MTTQAQIEAALNAYANKITEIYDRGSGLAPEDRKAAMTAALVAAAEAGEQDKEIERLRNIVEHAGVTIANLRKDKAATIERCAQVAEAKAKEIEAWSYQDVASRLAAEMLRKAAAAIRAMKDQTK